MIAFILSFWAFKRSVLHHNKLLILFLTEQEGRGPCQIVSTHLEVGGRIKRDASNGNTNVCINNREITKKELRILKVGNSPSVHI